MLRIQVLGNGMIPRGLGLAPRTELFPADRTTIATILSAREGFRVNYLNPETGKLKQIDRTNLQRVWDMYGNWTGGATTPVQPTPGVPQAPDQIPENPENGEGNGENGSSDETPGTENQNSEEQGKDVTPEENPEEKKYEEENAGDADEIPVKTADEQLTDGAQNGETTEDSSDEIPVKTVEDQTAGQTATEEKKVADDTIPVKVTPEQTKQAQPQQKQYATNQTSGKKNNNKK